MKHYVSVDDFSIFQIPFESICVGTVIKRGHSEKVVGKYFAILYLG